MAFSHIRIVADQFRIASSESDPGTTVFDLGAVQGASGIVLRKVHVGDLSVKTIHLKNACVTVPVMSVSASNFDTDTTTMQTFLSQSITTKGVSGSQIHILLLYTGPGTILTEFGALLVRCLVNGIESVSTWTVVANSASFVAQPQRVSMVSVAATGASQTITIQWQAAISLGGFGYAGRINAGARAMSIAMKR